MAFCPRCKREMGTTEAVCPHCGYDFPPVERGYRKGIAYSRLADVALIVGTIAAGLGCLGSVIGAFVALLRGDWLTGLVLGPLAFFLQMAMLVVFVRVQKL